MIIYRLTDRIPCKIGELTFWLSPLSYEQKMNLLECKKMEGGKEVVDGHKRARLSLKYGIKKVEGLSCADGSPYVPSVGPDGILVDEAVDEIMGLDCLNALVTVCVGLLNGVSDPKLEGVEVDFKGVVSEKKD
jgi:hypothetical protein